MGARERDKDFWYRLLSKEEKIKQGIVQDQIVCLVDSLLYKALDMSASDIHLEQNEDSMRVRYRIDGILYDQNSVDFDHRLPVLSRLKILASLDIAQKRIPQDGKIRIKVTNKKDKNLCDFLDLRISTFPSIHGEKMVIRILDQSRECLKLDLLGFNKKDLSVLKELISRPHGFFLVTGPTGSGKTTTLYAILSYLNNTERNIITMEDPVEYDLAGITQSQINTKSGFTFQKGLRSILRQDPDIIMVGEIRDRQTAQIAIEAALTGHLVFSTLHTNDAASAITRLIEMGVEPFLISASLMGVLAQRLVRKLCQNCKQEADFDKAAYKNLNDCDIKKSYISIGCVECLNLGYKGRTGIFELLMIDDIIRSLILNKNSSDIITKIAVKNGLKTLLDDGIDKIKQGFVSLDEVFRGVKN
ncbi:type II secretion system protein GspE [Candidatus Dependentiae bacterium]|nr:type II secretion system protein GspE [Candidatus Dependentiae bacterium]